MTDEKRPIIDFSKSFKVLSFIVFQAVMMVVIPFNLLVFSLRIKGRENIKVKPAFLISNHLLYLDGMPIAHTLWPKRTYFSALEETMRVRFLGTFLRLLGIFPLPEHTPLKQVIRPIERALKERGFVHFYPEGELYRFNQQLKAFHDGVFFLSILEGVPVIPITLVIKKRRLFGKKLSFLPYRVTSIVGESVYPESFRKPGVSKKEAIAAMRRHVRRVMQDAIDEEHRAN